MQINQQKNQEINTDPPEGMFPASQCFQRNCSIWSGSDATSEGIYDFIVYIKFMMVADCLGAQICCFSCSMSGYNKKKCAKRMMSRVLTIWFDQDLIPVQKAFMISLLISSSWWSLTVLMVMFHIWVQQEEMCQKNNDRVLCALTLYSAIRSYIGVT